MKMLPVDTAECVKEFLEFPARLFAGDPHYIRPLDKDVEAVFSRKQNKLFRTGDCARFVCMENGKTVGKVAVFINRKYKQQQPTGGIGFFDCVDCQITADFIFDHCRHWLAERGMEAMDGPINFGEREQFWGLLTEGFHEPLYRMNYNAQYYKKLFENYGFQPYFHQLCFGRGIHADVAENFLQMHARLSRNPNISARRMTKTKLGDFAKDFTEIYNKAWASHGEGKQLSELQTRKMFASMKPVINEHISWFAYDGDRPIAMWINLPDLNQWFKYLDGKFDLLRKLKFLWLKQFRPNTKMVGIVFGIVPEWQRKGVDGYLIWEGTKHLRKHTSFTEFEMQWIGDFNPKMIRIAENLDTELTRKLTTYRYLFDRSKKFERHGVL